MGRYRMVDRGQRLNKFAQTIASRWLSATYTTRPHQLLQVFDPPLAMAAPLDALYGPGAGGWTGSAFQFYSAKEIPTVTDQAQDHETSSSEEREWASLLTPTASPENAQQSSASFVRTPVREAGAYVDQTGPSVPATSFPIGANSVPTEQPNRPLHDLVGVDGVRHASTHLADTSSETLPVTQLDKENHSSFGWEHAEVPEEPLPHTGARYPRRRIEEWTSPPSAPMGKVHQRKKIPVESKQELATNTDAAERYSADREFQELMVDFLKLTSPGTPQSSATLPDPVQSHAILPPQGYAITLGAAQSHAMYPDIAQSHAVPRYTMQGQTVAPDTVQSRAILSAESHEKLSGTAQSHAMPSDVVQSRVILPVEGHPMPSGPVQSHAMHTDIAKGQVPHPDAMQGHVVSPDTVQSHTLLPAQSHVIYPGTMQGHAVALATVQSYPISSDIVKSHVIYPDTMQGYAVASDTVQSYAMPSDAGQSRPIPPEESHATPSSTMQGRALSPEQSHVMYPGAVQSPAMAPGTVQTPAMPPDTAQSHTHSSDLVQSHTMPSGAVQSHVILPEENHALLANTAQKHAISPSAEQTHANFSDLAQSHVMPSVTAQSHARPSDVGPDRERTGQRSEEAPSDLHQPGQETRSVAEVNAQIIASRTHNVLRAQPTPTPLPLRARHFLQPLVGIDLSGVRVHRGILAEQLTTSYQADAITVGNEVAIANGYTDDTPETLGLLAHEFTHVARRSDPRFVPPISGNISSTTMNLSPVTPFRSEVGAAPLPLEREQADGHPAQADEEALALQVESRAAQIAQGQIEQVAPFSTAGVDPGERQPPTRVPETAGSWDGLPAPWEPLPHWLTSLPPMMESPNGQPHNRTGIPTQSPVRMELAPIPTASMVDTEGSMVQRAGEERSQSVEEGGSTVPMEQPVVNTPEPDLDALAQQVHAILKRRLAVERRRAHR